MALKAKVQETQPASSGAPCSVARALAGLPPADRAVFVDLLGTPERPGRSAAYIYGVMQDERRDLIRAATAAADRGEATKAARLYELAEVYDIGNQTVNKHRGRKCRCFKAA